MVPGDSFMICQGWHAEPGLHACIRRIEYPWARAINRWRIVITADRVSLHDHTNIRTQIECVSDVLIDRSYDVLIPPQDLSAGKHTAILSDAVIQFRQA